MNESESRIRPLRQSQRDRIALILQHAYPSEVPAYRLAEESLQYSARIKELRHSGWLISNRVEIRDGRKYGYFRLMSKKPRVAAQTELPLFATEGGRG